MKQEVVRTVLRALYARVLRSSARELDPAVLRRSAVVFAPHQDDETLACGGTIIRKRQLGADVKIVFLTDGTQSHRDLIQTDELKMLRTQEALAAGAVLGVSAANVFFLGFEDGKLDQNQAAAIEKVKEILASFRPEEVFIPYSREKPADHSQTNRIVLAAVKQCRMALVVNEYPVWFWGRWPWIVAGGQQNRLWTDIKKSLRDDCGYLIKDFNSSVSIRPVLERKRLALESHQSQMNRLAPDQRWQTLPDVSQGEFLACFFQDREWFYRYSIQ